MFNFIKWASIAAFIQANSIITKRIVIFIISFYILNTFYSKWEILLLELNPNSLFYLLITYTLVIFFIFVWVLFSLPFFNSFSKSKKVLEVRNSIDTKSYDYEKIRDVRKFPKLKSSNERSLQD
jgi:hypothetical protein